jgi:F-type H+-transporting ATPase subunit delta
MIASPALSTADQIKAIDALLAKAGIKGILANFIHFVAAKRRLPALAGIIEAFSRLDAQANNIHAAQVVTAHALSDAQKNDLRRALEARAGGSVEMSVRIDADIIGGLIVKLGSRMIDASLKTKLNSLRLAMQES